MTFRSALAVRSCAVLLLLGCLPRQTWAHDISATFLDLTLQDATLVIRHRVPVAEADLLFQIDRNLDGRYDRTEIQGAVEPIQKYVNQKLAIAVNGREVRFDPMRFELWGDEDDHLFIDFFRDLPLTERVEQIRMESQLFQELVANHTTMIAVHAGPLTGQYALGASNPVGLWQAAETGGMAQFVRFLQLGIQHIVTGYDHVLFLIGLLLIGGSLLEVVKIVTSFTAAHSLTLALAVLGYVNPSPRLIEVGIAFSIAYIGMENLLKTQLTRRWQITFFFGLVHGFGFAHLLREMHLSSGQLATSLFSFNLGVEIGQVALVALIFPVLASIRHRSWHPRFLTGASTAVLGFGVFWFFQRLLFS